MSDGQASGVLLAPAMHMADQLLTPVPAAVLMALAGASLAVASRRARARFDPAQVPLMGVLGAFVFAAQMINFPILPGTSGHLGGGVLLAIILGPHAATLVMASILIVQCLIFQDGGLLALGANILNLGVIPCYLGYAVFRAVGGEAPTPRRLYAAVFLASMVGMVTGAAAVPLEVFVSGMVRVPLSKFLLVMVALHLLIGLAEALITFGVIVYLAGVRPQVLGAMGERLAATGGRTWSPRAVLASLLLVAVMLGGVVSRFASPWPDALNSVTSVEAAPGQAMVRPNENETVSRVSKLQQRVAPLPDYQWTGVGGVVGTIVTLLLVWGVGRALRRRAQPGLPAGHD